MEAKDKWTILMVCYKSNIYIDWQLKILYEFNDPQEFKVLLVENNSQESKNELDQIVKKYNDLHNNIEVCYYQPKSLKRPTQRIDEFGMIVLRDEHGETIDFATSKISSKYTLIQDPDFFFLQKNHLKILEEYLQSNVAIGAPYLGKVGFGKPDFPAAYGCAYVTSEIKNIEFIGGHNNEDALNMAGKVYPKKAGYGFSMDVGYKVRQLLSAKPYISFRQKRDKDPYIKKLGKVFGQNGFSLPCYYYLNKKNIGVHLFGGSRAADDLVGYKYLNDEQKKILNNAFLKVRGEVSEYFYNVVKNKNNHGSLNIGYRISLFLTSRMKIIFGGKGDSPVIKLLEEKAPRKKWTIGMVNYKTDSYIKYQLKILFENNDPSEFELVIIDNSYPHQKEELEALKAEYDSYNNIKIIYHEPSFIKELRGSLEHSEGLNLILQETNTPYLLVHDPDFFWIKKNYLKILESYLLRGRVAIGAPYDNPVRIGRPDFPAAFGCAFLTAALKTNKLNFDIGKSVEEIRMENKDVGWKVRERLSVEPYISFKQEKADITGIFGQHSFAMMSMQYLMNGEKFAYHLYRGSFVDDAVKYKDAELSKSAPQNWEDARKKYAEFFYILSKGQSKKQAIKKLKQSN